MKVLAGNTSIVIKPSLGVGEEAFNTVDVGSSANVLFFAVQDPLVFSPKGENPVSLKVIGVVDTAPLGMFQNERHESGTSSVGHREGNDFTVLLIHPKYQFLSFSSPASFALLFSAKEGLIKLKFPREGLHLLKRGVVNSFPDNPEDLLSSRQATGKVKPRPVGGDTQAEEIEEMSHLVEGDAESFKIGTSEIAERIATAGASESSVASPKFPLSTPWADSSSTPSELDKKSLTFWQVSGQGNCMFIRHKSIISQYHFLGYYPKHYTNIIPLCQEQHRDIAHQSAHLPAFSHTCLSSQFLLNY